jgi:hypothetical protein
MLNGCMPDLFQAMRPIWGALLFEHENVFCEPLNGPLWYLPAIFFMHVTIDLCRKTRYPHQIMISLCIISVILYAANKYYYFAPNLTPMGIFRRLPYYYMGYVFGQCQLFRNINKKWDWLGCICCLGLSIMLFHWHLQAYHANQYILHIALFYPVNISFLFGVLYGCKLLNNMRLSTITNLSIGTLVIIGLHIVAITATNYTVCHFLQIKGTPCYYWYEALPTTIAIVAVLYPIILWGKSHASVLFGRNSKTHQTVPTTSA